MLRLNSTFVIFEWKHMKNSKLETPTAIILMRTPLPVDTAHFAELREERVSVRITNPDVNTIVDAVGNIKSVRPEDSQKLLLESGENQDVLFRLTFDGKDFSPQMAQELCQLTMSPTASLQVEIEQHTPQMKLFDNNDEDDEFADGFS